MTPQTPERSEGLRAEIESRLAEGRRFLAEHISAPDDLDPEVAPHILQGVRDSVAIYELALAQLSAIQPSAEALDLSVFEGHTPGPWTAINHAHQGGDEWLLDDWWTVLQGAWDVSRNKAMEEGVVASAKYSAMKPKENAANASLIAAAPALLAEVIRLRAQLSPSSVSSVTREEIAALAEKVSREWTLSSNTPSDKSIYQALADAILHLYQERGGK